MDQYKLNQRSISRLSQKSTQINADQYGDQHRSIWVSIWTSEISIDQYREQRIDKHRYPYRDQDRSI